MLGEGCAVRVTEFPGSIHTVGISFISSDNKCAGGNIPSIVSFKTVPAVVGCNARIEITNPFCRVVIIDRSSFEMDFINKGDQ